MTRRNYTAIQQSQSTHKMKSLWRLTITFALILILSYGTLFAQTTYESLPPNLTRALLDSSIRYEILKPVAFRMQKENQHLVSENLALTAARKVKDQQHAAETARLAAELKHQKKQTRNQRLTSLALALLLIIASIQ